MDKKKEIYLVPYSHLDTQWRWEYPTTIKKYIKNTLDESIYLFAKYSAHQFNFTGALRYQMMKEYYPEKFERVRDLVAQDRWHLAGTCLDETDALVPSVESSIRNILYGDRWQRTEFGKSSRDYMLPDCFGFPGNLPSVMNHCGICGFSSNKLTWGSAVGVPFEIGVWKGPDGSEVVSAFNPCRYDDHLKLPISMNPGRLNRLKSLGEKNGVWKSFQYYGVGDIGGAPTEGSVKRAIASMKYYHKANRDITVRQGAADQFFYEITNEEKRQMDRYEGDLLLTNHSAGTITSAAIMKRWNRKNERLAFAAEAAAVVAEQVAGLPYPKDKIKSAWYRIIGSQMHDILTGTSTPLAYEYAQNDEVVALNLWTSVIEDSAKAIAPYVQGDGNILIYNPIGESRSDLVTIQLNHEAYFAATAATVVDKDGARLPAQIRKTDSGTYCLSFVPTLAPFGWSRYALEQKSEHFSDQVTIRQTENTFVIENEALAITITSAGEINSIYSKTQKRELLKQPLAYEFQKERPMKFPAWNMDWRDRKKAPYERIETGQSVKVTEEGPLKCTIAITTRYQESIFIKEVGLSKGSALVEFTERIQWRETGCSMKLAITGNLIKPKATYNWETSRIQRPVNHPQMFEVPSRYWADLSDESLGFSVIEDSKYGYDRPDEDTLRMTMLFTPALRFTNGFRDQKSQDWGTHTIRYAIFVHDGHWQKTDVLAAAFNQPIRAFEISTDDPSTRQAVESIVKASSHQLSILSVKKAEDRDGVIVRVGERYGEALAGELTFMTAIEDAYEVNGLEENSSSVTYHEKCLSVAIPANGIKAYFIKLVKKPADERCQSESIKLPFNARLIGKNGEQGNAILPYEWVPNVIESGNVDFNLFEDDPMNALQCQGQKIDMPTGYNTLSLLMSGKNDVDASFSWKNSVDNGIREDRIGIPKMTGFIGSWDTRIWKREPKHHLKYHRDYAWINQCIGVRAGSVTRDRLEWYATHTHKDGIDQAYQYGYLFTKTLRIPKGATSLTLPEDQRIYLVSATASNQRVQIQSCQYVVDEYDF